MVQVNTQLYEVIKPIVQGLGYELWGTEYSSRTRGSLLRIYIDSERGISIDDCEKVSRQLSAVLDVEDMIPDNYTLEVSSPGMDRPLFNEEHYMKSIGQRVTIRLNHISDGRRKFTGILHAVENSNITLLVDNDSHMFSIHDIEKANIIPQFN